ncbi:MAG: hypothetical protein OD817_03710, partial [Gammaproteobacteria bacterium]
MGFFFFAELPGARQNRFICIMIMPLCECARRTRAFAAVRLRWHGKPHIPIKKKIKNANALIPFTHHDARAQKNRRPRQSRR